MRFALFFAALCMCSAASAALLTSEVVQGTKKVCIYSDGSTRTISSIGLCPLTN